MKELARSNRFLVYSFIVFGVEKIGSIFWFFGSYLSELDLPDFLRTSGYEIRELP
jgi:hypothetical protein